MPESNELQNMSPEQIEQLQRQNCIFCRVIMGEVPSKKVHEDEYCVAILDISPANEGHVLIIPKEHYQIMPQVPDDVLGHMFIIAKKVSNAILMSTLGKSTSIFVANGAAAGQKAPHFMIHVIPRKSESEFFVLPSKEVDPASLESLRHAIIAKLAGILGKNPVEEAKEAQQPMPVKEPRAPPVPAMQRQEIPALKEAAEAEQKEEEAAGKRKVAKAGIKKEPGYLYYVDKEGDIARVPMARGRRKKKEMLSKPKQEKKAKTPGPEETSSRRSLDDISKMLLGE